MIIIKADRNQDCMSEDFLAFDNVEEALLTLNTIIESIICGCKFYETNMDAIIDALKEIIYSDYLNMPWMFRNKCCEFVEWNFKEALDLLKIANENMMNFRVFANR